MSEENKQAINETAVDIISDHESEPEDEIVRGDPKDGTYMRTITSTSPRSASAEAAMQRYLCMDSLLLHGKN